MSLHTAQPRREPLAGEGGIARTDGRTASGVDASQRGGHPALFLVSLALQLPARDMFEQGHSMPGQDEPAVDSRNRSSRHKPSISKRPGDLAPHDQVVYLTRGDAFGH